jgi:hypothetical protein
MPPKFLAEEDTVREQKNEETLIVQEFDNLGVSKVIHNAGDGEEKGSSVEA